MGGKIDHPGGGNARHVDDCGLTNLRVVWPGLWSLALANARDIVAELSADASLSRGLDADAPPIDLRELSPGVPVGEERRLTEMQPWLRYDEFEPMLGRH